MDTNATMLLGAMSSGVNHLILTFGVFMIVGCIIGAVVSIPVKKWLLSKGMSKRTAGSIAQGIFTLVVCAALVLCMLSLAHPH